MNEIYLTSNMREIYLNLFHFFQEMIERMDTLQTKMDGLIRVIFPNISSISSVYINKDNLQVYGDWEKEGVEPDILGRILDATTYEGKSLKFNDMTEEQVSYLKKYYELEKERSSYVVILGEFSSHFNN